jgi:aspartokinase
VSAVASKTGFNLFRVKTSFQTFLSFVKDISVPLRFVTQASSEVSFLCEKEKLGRVREILSFKKLDFTEQGNVVAVSVVGEGLAQSNPLFHRALGYMEKEKIDCLMTVANSVSVTFVVKAQFKESLANFLHNQSEF